MRNILIIVANDIEAQTIIAGLGLDLAPDHEQFSKSYSTNVYQKVIAGIMLRLISSGKAPIYDVDCIGASILPVATLAMEQFAPDLVINAGFADTAPGADLQVGTVYLGDNIYTHHDRLFGPDKVHVPFGIGRWPSLVDTSLLDKLRASIPQLKNGKISSGSSTIISVVEAAQLKDNQADIIDMEAAHLALLALRLNIPFFSLKEIKSSVGQKILSELPICLNQVIQTILVDNLLPEQKKVLSDLSQTIPYVTNILIIVAMADKEARAIIDKMGLEPAPDDEQLHVGYRTKVYKTTIKGKIIRLVSSGKDPLYGVDCLGASILPVATSAIKKFNPTIVVNAGSAGAIMVSGFSPGDVCFCEDKFTHHDRLFDPKDSYANFAVGSWSASLNSEHIDLLLKDVKNLKRGAISTGSSMIASAEENKQFQKNQAVMKDMEVAHLALLTQRLKIPFVAIKAISDLIDGEECAQQQFSKNIGDTMSRLAEILAAIVSSILDNNFFLRKMRSDLSDAKIAAGVGLMALEQEQDIQKNQSSENPINR